MLSLVLILLKLSQISIRTFRIEALVAPHHSHQILRFAQVDNIMRITRNHFHCFNPVTADLKLYDSSQPILRS